MNAIVAIAVVGSPPTLAVHWERISALHFWKERVRLALLLFLDDNDDALDFLLDALLHFYRDRLASRVLYLQARRNGARLMAAGARQSFSCL